MDEARALEKDIETLDSIRAMAETALWQIENNKTAETDGNVKTVSSENIETEENVNKTKNTAEEDGVKHSLIIKHRDGTVEELSDARNLTDEQAINYLKQAKKGMLKWNTYIPVRKDTPQVIIDTLYSVGETIENLSLVMQVRKAQQ